MNFAAVSEHMTKAMNFFSFPFCENCLNTYVSKNSKRQYQLSSTPTAIICIHGEIILAILQHTSLHSTQIISTKKQFATKLNLLAICYVQGV